MTVMPVVNRTGEALLVRGETLFDRIARVRPTSVTDVMVVQARRMLRARGFTVAEHGAEDAPVLRFEVRRWNERAQDTSAVTVSVAADLTAPGSDEVLWRAERRNWRISTLGAPTLVEARARAARSIVRTFLANWQADRDSSRRAVPRSHDEHRADPKGNLSPPTAEGT